MTNNLEIERKWLVKNIPSDILSLMKNCEKKEITQAYISHKPHIRIRHDGDKYYLNFKKVIEKEDIVRKEFETEITEEEYNNLHSKIEGLVIKKTRYYIPIEKDLIIELDIFHDEYDGLIYAEIEFMTKDSAINFKPLKWFDIELTGKKEYTNAGLSLNKQYIKKMFLC